MKIKKLLTYKSPQLIFFSLHKIYILDGVQFNKYNICRQIHRIILVLPLLQRLLYKHKKSSSVKPFAQEKRNTASDDTNDGCIVFVTCMQWKGSQYLSVTQEPLRTNSAAHKRLLLSKAEPGQSSVQSPTQTCLLDHVYVHNKKKHRLPFTLITFKSTFKISLICT